jgi:4a-hydroxytetrahydrobiopterin dehydratase
MSLLSPSEIAEQLIDAPEWKFADSALRRNFAFNDFREAMSFVNAVADEAERAGHHPDIDIRYNKVNLALASHDAGGITDKDFALARRITTLTI